MSAIFLLVRHQPTGEPRCLLWLTVVIQGVFGEVARGRPTISYPHSGINLCLHEEESPHAPPLLLQLQMRVALTMGARLGSFGSLPADRVPASSLYQLIQTALIRLPLTPTALHWVLPEEERCPRISSYYLAIVSFCGGIRSG